MLLTERIALKRTRVLFDLCHATKDLYNRANYLIRQRFFKDRHWTRYGELDAIMKHEPSYRALPAQTAQQALRMLERNWKSYFEVAKEWKVHPGKFLGMPRLPRYRPQKGEYVAVFTRQNAKIRDGYVVFPRKLRISPVKTRVTLIREARIVPRGRSYVLELVNDRGVQDRHLDKANVLGVDVGLNNTVACANNIGARPFVIRGGPVKSINQFYNKERARLQAELDQQGAARQTARMARLSQKREWKLADRLHKISRAVVRFCEEHNIGSVAIGHNVGWKQAINLGSETNQAFVQVPFSRLISMIQYKAKLAGIEVAVVDEAHTSRCSFLDGEPVEHHESYLGRRISRGLFRSAKGIVVNADVNGAYNIIRKAFPNAFANGIEGLALAPRSLAV